MERLLDDRALAQEMRRRGLERSRRFDWDDSARKTLAFYRKVLGR
jgi:glycosyltransferase involved in cell wall biosynthesis